MGAFAVAGDLLRQVERHVVQRKLEGGEFDRSSCSRGDDHRRVARRGVGVDAHAVEGPVDDATEAGVEVGGRDLRVGEQQRDVRRHVGLDHPDALGHPDHASSAARDRGLGHFGVGVGGHHPAGGSIGIVRRECGRQGGDACTHPLDRVATSDDTGRGDDHLGRLTSEPRRNRASDLECIGMAVGSGGDVGVLGDHHDGPGDAVGDVRTAERDARAGEAAPGEDSGRRRRDIGGHHHEVVAVVLDADVGDVAVEAGRQGGHASRPALIAVKIDAIAATCWSSR